MTTTAADKRGASCSTHQAELQRLRREVASLRGQLRHAQRLATVGTMTAMVAHEFNNILTPVINYARLARNNPALTDKAIERAAAGGEQAVTICRAILDMTRSGAAEPERVTLGEIVRESLAAMARDPQKDRIELAVDVPDHLELVARRAELQQVLLNLLINARQAVVDAPQPRRIEVIARAHDGEVEIRVADTGVGIDEDVVQRIFDPFFTTRSDGADAGHGLGLTLCRDIVESCGGWIEVDSAPAAGTTFAVHLPSESSCASPAV
ncbi:MAG: sensor histidine kinase [Planctomycetota bacterium]